LALLANWLAKAITASWQLVYPTLSREVPASVMERRRARTNSFIGLMGKIYNEVGRLFTLRVIGM
jgi:hypothetical protein